MSGSFGVHVRGREEAVHIRAQDSNCRPRLCRRSLFCVLSARDLVAFDIYFVGAEAVVTRQVTGTYAAHLLKKHNRRSGL